MAVEADRGGPFEEADGLLTRERAMALVLLAATTLAAYVCYLIARPFLPALAWALALAVVAHPLHAWVASHIRRPNVAAALSVLVVTVIIIGPAVFVGQQLVREAAEGARMVREGVESGRWRAAAGEDPRLAPVVSWVEAQAGAGGGGQGPLAAVTSRASSYVSGSAWAVAELLITLFALFYLFRDRRAALDALRSLVPLSDSETIKVFARVGDTIYATVYGTLAVAAVQGLLMGLMFWWLGLPAPLLWGVVMGLLSVIPVLGTFVVWVPAAVFLALQGSWGKALILTAWGTAVVGTVDNLLYPVLVGKRLRLHTLPVFIAIVGGLMLFGASGLILGPMALAVMVALLDVWRRRTAGGQAADTKGTV